MQLICWEKNKHSQGLTMAYLKVFEGIDELVLGTEISHFRIRLGQIAKLHQISLLQKKKSLGLELSNALAHRIGCNDHQTDSQIAVSH